MRHLRKLWRDKHGQDFIEYALLAGFLAVAVGALSPTVATNVGAMFSRVARSLSPLQRPPAANHSAAARTSSGTGLPRRA
jgi:Flp pilus assembly pilin Flp